MSAMEVRHHLIYDPLKVTACTSSPQTINGALPGEPEGVGEEVEEENV